MSDWIAIAAMVAVAGALPVGVHLVSWMLRPSVPERQKEKTYESGEVPTGDTRIRFSIQYYLIALMFLIFDIEVLLVVPWAVYFVEDTSTYLPALTFITVLFVGMGWAWRNGGMQWIRPEGAGRTRPGEA